MRKNLLLLVASSLVCLATAELVTRRFFPAEFDAELIAEKNAQTNFGAFTQPSQQPGLVYELRPGTRLGFNELSLIAISDHGPYRVAENGEQKVFQEAVRLAVIGDSTSFGWRVPYHATYAEVLRKSLEAHLQRPVTLRNFSVPGYNSQQERIVFEHQVLPWRPHLTILHYDHNDWEPAIHEKPASYLDPSYGDNALRSALVKLVTRRLRIAREVRRHQATREFEHRLHEAYAYEGSLYDQHLEQLHRIAELASDRNMPIVCLVFDAFLARVDAPRADVPRPSDHYRHLHQGLLASLSKSGYEVLDMFHPYQRLMADQGWRDLSRLWVAPDDGHPSDVGHSLIAQALEQFILGNPRLREVLDQPVAGSAKESGFM